VPTRVRDWATVDYYALLGVPADASGDDIARAFRAEAKRSHPDATGDPVAAERFKDLAAAYTVLSDRRTRRDYDRVRAMVSVDEPRIVSTPASRTTAVARKPWSRRRAWASIVSGVLLTVVGLGVVALTWHLHDRDSAQRARFVPVVATRVDNGDVSFTTREGHKIVTAEPSQHGEGTGLGPTVAVRYDPSNPQHVVVDASTFGRDITLVIVALKMLVGGPVFAVVGFRRLRVTRMRRI
jgi:hypothetical protein